MSNAIRCVLLGTLAFLLAPGLAAQDTLRVTQVVVEGETVTLPGGGTGTVSTIQTSLFTNRNAEVGFSVDVQGDDGVWFGDAPIWLNSQATSHTLTGAEFTMGIGDNGEFIYSPSIDGNDGVWTDQGYLLADGDPAPGFEGDTLVTFNSRPTMGANGTAYWVAGVNDGAGGTSTVNRALYMSTDRTPATTSVVLRSGDIVGGFPLAGGSDGIGFNYEFSDDGTHHILGLVLETGSSTDDNVVYVDGAIVAREAHPNGSGIDNWDNFDIHRILDDGTYGFTGDTDGSTATDEFIAINGTIVLREGDVVDGVTLGSGVVAFDLNADGLVVFGWSLTSSSDEGLFVADISDIPGTARLVARTNDLLDTDGDGTPEWVLTDVNPSASTGQGAGALAPDGTFFISLGVEPVGGGTEVDGAFAFDFGGGDECEQDLTATLDDPNPAPGDVMTFAVTVTNNSPDPAPLDLWLVATGPANKTVRLGGGTLPGGATVNRNVRVRVPGNAPQGTYDLDLNLGQFPDDVCDAVSFTVEVSGAAVGGGTAFEALDDFFAASATTAGQPAAVAPNPFARQTAITYEVAAASDVRLSVYDVLGREVAVLVDGRQDAGAHQAVFDASGLAAGTYLYRLVVGSDVQTGRMTLTH